MIVKFVRNEASNMERSRLGLAERMGDPRAEAEREGLPAVVDSPAWYTLNTCMTTSGARCDGENADEASREIL